MRLEPGDAVVIDAGGAQHGPRSSSLHVVYDSTHMFDATTGAPADFYFGAVTSHLLGDAFTISLPHAGMGPWGRRISVLDEVTFGIAWNDHPLQRPIHVYHEFYDESAMFAETDAELLRRPLGGFVITVQPCDLSCNGFFNIVTVIGLSTAMPIHFSDNYVIDQILVTDENDVPDPTALVAFSGDGTESGRDGIMAEGRSDDVYYLDQNANGYFDGNEGFYYFGGAPTNANMYLKLSVISCDADIDGSGFVDTEDFDAFIRAFEVGC